MKALTTAIIFFSILIICCNKQETPAVNIHVAALQGNTKAIQQHIKAGNIVYAGVDYFVFIRKEF